MEWQDLERKHLQDWVEFEKLKLAAWQKIKDDEKAMYTAFSNNPDRIPESVYERVKQDEAEWHRQWGKDGEKVKAVQEIHRIQRDALKEQAKQSILEQMRKARELNRSKSKDHERDE